MLDYGGQSATTGSVQFLAKSGVARLSPITTFAILRNSVGPGNPALPMRPITISTVQPAMSNGHVATEHQVGVHTTSAVGLTGCGELG